MTARTDMLSTVDSSMGKSTWRLYISDYKLSRSIRTLCYFDFSLKLRFPVKYVEYQCMLVQAACVKCPNYCSNWRVSNLIYLQIGFCLSTFFRMWNLYARSSCEWRLYSQIFMLLDLCEWPHFSYTAVFVKCLSFVISMNHFSQKWISTWDVFSEICGISMHVGTGWL